MNGLQRWLARPVSSTANLMLSAGCLLFGAAVLSWVAANLLSVGKAGALMLAVVLLVAAAGAVACVLCIRWPRRPDARAVRQARERRAAGEPVLPWDVVRAELDDEPARELPWLCEALRHPAFRRRR